MARSIAVTGRCSYHTLTTERSIFMHISHLLKAVHICSIRLGSVYVCWKEYCITFSQCLIRWYHSAKQLRCDTYLRDVLPNKDRTIDYSQVELLSRLFSSEFVTLGDGDFCNELTISEPWYVMS